MYKIGILKKHNNPVIIRLQLICILYYFIFRFPLDNPLLLKRWLENIQLPNWEPLDNNKICSDHFDSSYIKKFRNAYELNSNAIPSIHPEACICCF